MKSAIAACVPGAMRTLLRRLVAALSVPLALSVPDANAQVGFVFPNQRTSYVLNLAANGTDVVDKTSGAHTLVPFGAQMLFAGAVKYSKNTVFTVHNVRSHAEAFGGGWNASVDLPVDLLSTGEASTWPGHAWGDPFVPFASPTRFPDRPDKAVVAYVNPVDFGAIGHWDPAFDPAWDKDGDAIIDPGVTNLPAYVDPKVFDAGWKNYVAAYWTDAWRQQLQKKIDLTAVEHFDGVYFDMTQPYRLWSYAYPSMNLLTLQQQYADLFRWASNYAKTTYGTAFLITANLDLQAKNYFPDLGNYFDAGFYQQAFWDWNYCGVVNGYGLSVSADHFANPYLDFIKNQGLSVLDTDQIGTGNALPGLNSVNCDDQITVPNLMKLFKWAIQSGSTPYSTTKYFGAPYSGIFPRFVRMLPGLPSTTNSTYSTWVIGSDADDTIVVGGSNNVVYGGPGNDTIVGRAGINTAYYLGAQSKFAISQSNGKTVVTDVTGAEGTDTLINIQWLQFADQLVSVPPIASSNNYQGLWWKPDEPYWGVNLAHQGDRIFATWYTYDTSGNAYWLSMLADRTTATSNAYKGDIHVDVGPPFDNFVGKGSPGKVGDGTLTFSDADNGSFFYEVTAGGATSVQQTKAITRYNLGGAQPACIYDAAPNLAAATNYQDLWWTPGEDGWGVNFAHQGDQLFATWYTYGTNNAPLWLSALMTRVGTNAFRGPLTRTSGPRFDNYKASDIAQPIPTVGTATATFTDGNHATFAYSTNGAGGLPTITNQSKSITRYLFAGPAGTACQ